MRHLSNCEHFPDLSKVTKHKLVSTKPSIRMCINNNVILNEKINLGVYTLALDKPIYTIVAG